MRQSRDDYAQVPHKLNVLVYAANLDWLLRRQIPRKLLVSEEKFGAAELKPHNQGIRMMRISYYARFASKAPRCAELRNASIAADLSCALKTDDPATSIVAPARATSYAL